MARWCPSTCSEYDDDDDDDDVGEYNENNTREHTAYDKDNEGEKFRSLGTYLLWQWRLYWRPRRRCWRPSTCKWPSGHPAGRPRPRRRETVSYRYPGHAWCRGCSLYCRRPPPASRRSAKDFRAPCNPPGRHSRWWTPPWTAAPSRSWALVFRRRRRRNLLGTEKDARYVLTQRAQRNGKAA